MFYRNTRYSFKLPAGAPSDIAGAVIVAAALPRYQIIRKERRKVLRTSSYLQHRLFDPQLYLAGLDKDRASEQVTVLASYPWFADPDVPEFSTKEYKRLKDWEAKFDHKLLEAWEGEPASDPRTIAARAKTAIDFQLDLECEALILPTPLVRAGVGGLELQMSWLDAGIAHLRREDTGLPVFATVALTQDILAGSDPDQNELLATLADQMTSREIDGVYLVMEQTVETEYVCRDERTLKSLLRLAHDIVRVGRKRLIVNNLGVFGAVLTAVGAEIFASDFYRSSRSLRLAELIDKSGGTQMPRYFSPTLLGDVGLEKDMQAIAKAGLLERIRINTGAAEHLHEALKAGEDMVFDWQHERQRVASAKAHYLEAMMRIGRTLGGMPVEERERFVHKWLQKAVRTAEVIRAAGVKSGYYTELSHQQSWLSAYEWWKAQT